MLSHEACFIYSCSISYGSVLLVTMGDGGESEDENLPKKGNRIWDDEDPDEPHKEPNEDGFIVYSREEWRARPPRIVKPFTGPATVVRFVQTSSEEVENKRECEVEMRFLQNLHTRVQYQEDIRYNFAIGIDGQILEGRGWNAKAGLMPHPWDNTQERIDIAYIGQYLVWPPPWKMIRSGLYLIEQGVKNNHISPNCKVVHMDKDLNFAF